VIPAGYEWCAGAGGEAVVLDAAAPWLQALLSSGETVHGWAGTQPGVEELRGRGTVYSVQAPTAGPDGRARWAVRHYRRGGAVRHVLGDRYLRRGPTRPELELAVTVRARALGVPTPAVVAGIWYGAGAFYRADLVTELLPESRSLAELLFGEERSPRAEQALEAAGRLVRRTGDRGLLHPDVNAGNVVFSGSPDRLDAYVLDFDRARLVDPAVIACATEMIVRLRRSLAKLGRACGRPLTEAELRALRAGFESP